MTTSTEPELKVRFLISSPTTHPASISVALGVEPTQTWLKGDRVHPKALNQYDQNGWVRIEIAHGGKASLEALVNKLFQTIDLKRMKQLTVADSSLEVELSVIVHLTESAPSMFLSAHQLRCLAEIGAEIDIDIYPNS